MLERAFEILLRTHPKEFLPNDWSLKAQQLNLDSGRLDMLYKDAKSTLHVVELKKGLAPKKSVDQVLRYAADIRIKIKKTDVVPWVIANEISLSTNTYANSFAVKTLAIPLTKIYQVIKKKNIPASDLKIGRLGKGVLHGGTGGVRANRLVDNEEIFRTINPDVAHILREINTIAGIEMTSGAMQTSIKYKGIKLGGYNRKHRGGHAYISTGVIINREIEFLLKTLNFTRETKTQEGSSHEHAWWELKSDHIKSFPIAIGAAIDIVDDAF